MQLLGLSLSIRPTAEVLAERKLIAKAADLITHLPSYVSNIWGTVQDSFAGAWQRNIRVDQQGILAYTTVWACVTLIANDVAKLWVNLVFEVDGICMPKTDADYSPVLKKPNHYQTRIKFVQSWVISLLCHGNTYVLKERQKGKVVALYVLDPTRVTVLQSPTGDVYYQLKPDVLAGVMDGITVPASEIIHDVYVGLWHPLIGVSPLYACGMAAMQGLKILQNSTRLFANGSQPGGMLTAPQNISTDTAKRLEEYWAANYAGDQNIGKIVVLGDGLMYHPMAMTAVDAEVVAQLKLTDERICATFHVPGYMIGIGPPPPYTDLQSINLQYYALALQHVIENMESLLEEGLELPPGWHVEFDEDALARMDTKSQMVIAKEGVLGGILKPDEARARFDLAPVPGGDTPYLQQQMFSLAALDKRDQAAPAPSTTPAGTTPAGTPAPAPADAGTRTVDDTDVFLKALDDAWEADAA